MLIPQGIHISWKNLHSFGIMVFFVIQLSCYAWEVDTWNIIGASFVVVFLSDLLKQSQIHTLKLVTLCHEDETHQTISARCYDVTI